MEIQVGGDTARASCMAWGASCMTWSAACTPCLPLWHWPHRAHGMQRTPCGPALGIGPSTAPPGRYSRPPGWTPGGCSTCACAAGRASRSLHATRAAQSAAGNSLIAQVNGGTAAQKVDFAYDLLEKAVSGRVAGECGWAPGSTAGRPRALRAGQGSEWLFGGMHM